MEHLIHTSITTIANVKTSPSLLTGLPSKISGAAHVVALSALGPTGEAIDFSPRTMVVNPKSVRRAWPSPSIRMFVFKFVGIQYLTARKETYALQVTMYHVA